MDEQEGRRVLTDPADGGKLAEDVHEERFEGRSCQAAAKTSGNARGILEQAREVTGAVESNNALDFPLCGGLQGGHGGELGSGGFADEDDAVRVHVVLGGVLFD